MIIGYLQQCGAFPPEFPRQKVCFFRSLQLANLVFGHPSIKQDQNKLKKKHQIKTRIITRYMGVSKNSGKTPKMDGENKGKPYEQMDDLGGPPLFLETPIYTQKHPKLAFIILK